MKIRWILLTFMVLSLVLTACGGDSGGGDPVSVVESAMEKVKEMDMDGAVKYVCKDKQQAFKDELDIAGAFGSEMEESGVSAEEFLDAIKINMDIKYEEKSKDDNNAVVHVSGEMKIEFDSEKLKDIVKKMLGEAGEEVSDEDLDMYVGMFEDELSQATPLDEDIKLIKEDGDWKICDDMAITP